MFFSLDWHPFEIRRRLQIFVSALIEDSDFRYPEVRHRQVLEMNSLLENFSSPVSTQFLKDLESSIKKISIFEWAQVFEWNERIQSLKVLIALDRILKKENPPEGNERVFEKIRERLRHIAKLMKERNLSKDPSTLELILYRWKVASLRDEAYYLMSRWPS
ncbi:MAG: hypothetical protein J0L93_06170 [Deltaproteobacteria bacterium]|nr:hypothetical protein [Deltaproteobacteria bacterium]